MATHPFIFISSPLRSYPDCLQQALGQPSNQGSDGTSNSSFWLARIQLFLTKAGLSVTAQRIDIQLNTAEQQLVWPAVLSPQRVSRAPRTAEAPVVGKDRWTGPAGPAAPIFGTSIDGAEGTTQSFCERRQTHGCVFFSQCARKGLCLWNDTSVAVQRREGVRDTGLLQRMMEERWKRNGKHRNPRLGQNTFCLVYRPLQSICCI